MQGILSSGAEIAFAFFEDEGFYRLSAARLCCCAAPDATWEGAQRPWLRKHGQEFLWSIICQINIFSLSVWAAFHSCFLCFFSPSISSPSFSWSNPFSDGKHHYCSKQDEIRLSLPQSQGRQKPKRKGQGTTIKEVCRMPTQQWQLEIQDRAVNHTRK